jgi:asparagine synthase (glutamine-hydrolysing)
MCGISGAAGADAARLREAVARMTAAQRHRGPDDSGEELVRVGDGLVGLGHRRLSILDLSPLGHQPMRHAATGSTLCYNGEVYNFRELRRELEREGEAFRSGSDTEVLLAGLVRHGEAFLARLEGMYAFAFVDVPGRRLLLARDPAGIKPLYLACVSGEVLFASEVRAVLASGLVPAKVDRRGAAGLLAYGAVPGPLTLFRDVAALPPGSWQSFTPRDGGWTTAGPRTFWRYPALRPGVEEGEAVTAVRDTLGRAVRDHLVSDVPVGIFLSGGLDSTVVAGLAARQAQRPCSFTVHFADQPDFSEREPAAETARLFGLEHVGIDLPSAEAEAATHDWLAALDQPSMDGLNVYVISRAVRRHGIKVALSGLGGDELFGGYPSFRDVPRLRRVLRRLRWLPARARRGLGAALAVGRPVAVRRKLADMFGGPGRLSALYLHRRRSLSDRQMDDLGFDARELGLTPEFLPPEVLAEFPGEEDDPVRAVAELESRFYQANVLLRDADANGMAHGLEVRVPFLDRRVLDLVHALTGGVRLPPSGKSKHLLRRAFAPLLRPELLRQAKRGFALPVARWMLGPLRRWCETALTALKETGLLRPEGVDRVWSDFCREPESPMWSRAFTLCILGHYLQVTAGRQAHGRGARA